MKKQAIITFLLWAFLFPLTSLASNRVEELFLWKLSEELKLTVKEEKEITKLIQDLNQKKSKVSQNMDQLMVGVKTAKNQKEFLTKYRSYLSDYNQISLSEFDGVKKILGSEKTLQYFYVKNDLSQKIKHMLSGTSGPDKDKKPLPEPKVIEEK